MERYYLTHLSMTPLELIALLLAVTHFGVPLAYYWYLKKKWLGRPWSIKTDPNYEPKVSVIVPTYMEAGLIEEKLDNIYSQDYPRDKLEVIVVDSASTDGTLEEVKQWTRKHPDMNLKLIQESERRGKAHALNIALRHVTGEIIVVTDADSRWPTRNALREAVKWLADPSVGAVSCLKKPANPGIAGVEEGYRQYYNTLRLAESKAWSTPIFHGELAAFKRKILEELGGFPTDIGSDDSYTATRIALMGYRAITPEDIVCVEMVPSKGYSWWRVRRAQHLIQHFVRALKLSRGAPREFKPVVYMESYLHLVNPWMLLAAAALMLASAASGSMLAAALLVVGALLLIYKPYRTWIATQLYLVVAALRNLWTKEIVWEKQAKSIASTDQDHEGS